MAAKTYSLKTVLSCRDELSEKLKTVRKSLMTLDRSFANTTKAASDMAVKFAAPLTAIAGAGLFSVKGAVDSFMALGDSVDKASIRAGVATGALQRLRAAAQLSGMSAEQMDKALSKLSYQMGKAASGENDNLVQMFKELGVQWKDGKGKARDAASVMRELADAVKANEDPADRLRMLTSIFGDDLAAYLVPALQGGAEGLDAMAAKADELGIVMSERDVKAAAALGDSFSLFKDVITAVSAKIGASLAPTLMKLIEQIQKAVVANKELIAQRINKLVEQLAGALAKVDFVAVIDGTIRFAEVCSKAFEAVGGLKGVAIAAAAIFAGQALTSVVNLGKAVWGLSGAFYAAVGWPGMIAAAVVAVAGVVYTHWDEICAFFKETFAAIGEWFSSAWVSSVDKVKSIWTGFVAFLEPVFKWFEGKFEAITEALPDFSKIAASAKSILPDWVADLIPSAQATPVLQTVASPSASPAAALGAGAVDGSVTIKVMTDAGSRAEVERIATTSGNVDVESGGAYDYVDTF